MNREVPLSTGEVYHVYNRGAHKQKVFTSPIDYARFQLLLYLGNAKDPVHMGNLLSKYKGPTFIKIYQEHDISKEEKLVDILAYSLLPNHFHLVLKQKVNGGISLFLKKVATAYSMYFNGKYDHSGTLFQGRFKSSHVDTPEYLRWLFAYVYLNAADLCKENALSKKTTFLRQYRYSSLPDALDEGRPERSIVAIETLLTDFKEDHTADIIELTRIIKDRPL